ncbi:hypothetical protein TNIN_484151 [Trichonephila inaurata madagascariensis]|uniref:Uncharacterized protein n=1 Tax=Trichonephila inaurata madagascariensis TaxID=2747483 RepID=A0A8X6YBP8_9ARAC|nr:hypothetical protein TNIN_484151 [Trichonephila inaurata madagascariensis]
MATFATEIPHLATAALEMKKGHMERQTKCQEVLNYEFEKAQFIAPVLLPLEKMSPTQKQFQEYIYFYKTETFHYSTFTQLLHFLLQSKEIVDMFSEE